MTDERKKFYVDLIKSSHSLCEVCRKAGIVPTTGNYNTLKRVISDEDIDISHFKRLGGKAQKKMTVDEYLVEGSTIQSFKLKNKILAAGIKERRCECCKNTEWMGMPINLELHHKNGNPRDNRIENLEILCPNCHSYTDTYGGKNQKMNIAEKKKTEKPVKMPVIETKKNKKKKLFDLTPKKFLEDFEKAGSFVGVGKINGVSDNAIRKWCKRNGFPVSKNEINEIIKNLRV